MASLLSCASYLGRFPTHSLIILKLFFLTVLESRAPLSSRGLEAALQKFLNECTFNYKAETGTTETWLNPFTMGKSCQNNFPNSVFILCFQLISYIVVII